MILQNSFFLILISVLMSQISGEIISSSSREQDINDAIVLVTGIILFAAFLIWTIIFCTRFYKLQSAALPPSDPLADHKFLTKKNVQDNIEETTRKSKAKKALSKKNRSKAGSTVDGASETTTGEAARMDQSEQSYLLNTPGSHSAADQMREMMKESPKSKGTLSVKTMFTLVMSDGMTLTLHTLKGPKPINMVLIGSEIHWKTAKLFAKKRSKLSISEIISIPVGKTTDVFKLPASAPVPEECCFSIITTDLTLDLQVSSKVEREAVVQGFLALMREARGDLA